MNYTQKLMKKAEPLIEELKKLKEVKAIAFYGSVGRRIADKYSDIDIMCYCEKRPKKSIRNKILKKLGAKKKSDLMDINSFWLGKKEVTLWFKPISEMKRILKEFSRKNCWIDKDIDNSLHKIKIVHDPKGMLKRWKNKTRYPKWMQKKWVEQIQFIHSMFEFIVSSVKRKNFIWIDDYLNGRIESLIHIIYALNKEYYCTLKWFSLDIKKFRIKPKNCLKRIEKIKSLDSRRQIVKKLDLLNDFCEDLYRICKKKYPKLKPPVYDYRKRKEIIKEIKKLLDDKK